MWTKGMAHPGIDAAFIRPSGGELRAGKGDRNKKTNSGCQQEKNRLRAQKGGGWKISETNDGRGAKQGDG